MLQSNKCYKVLNVVKYKVLQSTIFYTVLNVIEY